MSIRDKLLVPLLLLTLSILGASHLLAFDPLHRLLATERIEAEQRTLNAVAQTLVPDLLAGDLAKIHETLEETGERHPWWQGLALASPEGHRLYPLSPPSSGDGLLRLDASATLGSKTVGRLTISVDREKLIAPAVTLLLRMEASIAVLLMAGTLLVMLVQGRTVIRPMDRLAKASLAISQGAYDTPLPIPAGDEVGKLILAFQAMREAVDIRENELRQSEQRLAAVIDNSAEAILSVSSDGRILSFNKAAEDIFGVLAKQILGARPDALVPMEGVNQAEGLEMQANRFDGTPFPALVTAGQVETQSGPLTVLTIIDLTQRKEAESRMKESEGRFRDLAEAASDWFWETDTEYRLTFVSERIGAILGVKPAAIMGFSYFDIGLSDHDPGLAQMHAEDLDARRPFRDVMFSIGPVGGKDGKIVRISGMPFFDEDGAFIGYRGVGADITREAQAESRARQARQQLADAMESITDAIALYDADDKLVLCNGEYRRMFDRLATPLPVGTRFEDILRDSNSIDVFDTEDKTLEEWITWRLDLHAQADGESFQVRLRDGRWLMCREYRTADGGVVGVRTDITPLKRREQDLELLKHSYQLILDCAGDGIVGLDDQGRVTFANRMAASLLETTPQAMIGATFVDTVGASPSDRAAIAEACASGVAEKVDDALFSRAQSAPLPVEFLAASLTEEDRVVGAVLVFRDVAMRRQYERALADQHAELERLVAERTEELKQAQKEALQASRLASVGQLAAGIAHEINTPIQYVGDNLTFIQNAAQSMIPLLSAARELAGTMPDNPEAKTFSERFDEAGLDFLMEETPAAVAQSLEGVAQVARIVLSMKEFSHPGTTQKSAVNLNRALDSTLVVSRNTWKHVAELETRFDPELPLVNCHPGEMNQVFLNLIVNAAHAIEESGKPQPGSIIVETVRAGDSVEIRVTDSGTGIPDDIRERIFDPFFTTKDVGKGTGQGLSICYDVVVTKHGGQIEVGGKPGEGAQFIVRLPIAG